MDEEGVMSRTSGWGGQWRGCGNWVTNLLVASFTNFGKVFLSFIQMKAGTLLILESLRPGKIRLRYATFLAVIKTAYITQRTRCNMF